MRVHFRSGDKDGGYTIRSAVLKNPMLHANVTALYLIELELLPVDYIAEIGIFNLFGSCDLDLDPTIFIYELDPRVVKKFIFLYSCACVPLRTRPENHRVPLFGKSWIRPYALCPFNLCRPSATADAVGTLSSEQSVESTHPCGLLAVSVTLIGLREPFM